MSLKNEAPIFMCNLQPHSKDIGVLLEFYVWDFGIFSYCNSLWYDLHSWLDSRYQVTVKFPIDMSCIFPIFVMTMTFCNYFI